MLEQSRVLDKRGLVRKLGTVPDRVLSLVLKTLREFYEE